MLRGAGARRVRRRKPDREKPAARRPALIRSRRETALPHVLVAMAWLIAVGVFNPAGALVRQKYREFFLKGPDLSTRRRTAHRGVRTTSRGHDWFSFTFV